MATFFILNNSTTIYANNLKLLCNLGSYYCIDTIKCGINGLHEISNGNGEDLLDGLHPNSHGAKKMGYYNYWHTSNHFVFALCCA